jgi:hypothetical protein
MFYLEEYAATFRHESIRSWLVLAEESIMVEL